MNTNHEHTGRFQAARLDLTRIEQQARAERARFMAQGICSLAARLGAMLRGATIAAKPARRGGAQPC